MNQFLAEWQEWHDRRIAGLATRHGWLSVTGLRWLAEGPHRWDDVMGTWHVGADGWVTVTLQPGESGGPTAQSLALASAPEPGREVRLGDPEGFAARLAEGESLLWFSDATVVYELLRRGGDYAVRLRDSRSPLLRSFVDVPTFAPDPSWALAAAFVPEVPRELPIGTAWPGLSLWAKVTGSVTFTVRGERHRLLVTGDPREGLSLTFHDATNNVTTPSWRQVALGIPSDDGHVVIDFNRATNFPFAFTPYATCPAPVEGNVLPFAVEAGEQLPRQTFDDLGVTTPVLVIENDRVSPLGRLGEWFREDGLVVDVIRAWDGEPLPPMSGYRAVVLLGGRASPSSTDRAPWLAEEIEFARDLLSARVPVLGICLGAQLLALAAGGKVSERSVVEVGYTGVDLTPEGARDALFAALPESFAAMQFHRDEVSHLPAGGVVLAGNATTRIQAFRAGVNAWGVQFHPEWDAEEAMRWKPELLAELGYDARRVREEAARADARWTPVWRDFARRFAALIKV